MEINLVELNNVYLKVINFGIGLVLILYLIFAIIVVRQTHLMSSVVITGFNKFIIVFAYVHLVFALLTSLFLMTVLF